jgi:hypothetical protein
MAAVSVAAAVLVGCAASHATTTKPSATIRFFVTGVGQPARLAYIRGWPMGAGESAGPTTVLSSAPRLPFHATRRVAAPRADDRYTIWAPLMRDGHLTCTLRIGRVSATGHVTGAPDALTVCHASLWWSARHGRWVKS